jgi:hypothetical protein
VRSSYQLSLHWLIPNSHGDKIIMPYRESAKQTSYEEHIQRWVVVRLCPNFKHQDLARFHKCSDAEGYCQVMRRLYPDSKFQVMFDPKDRLASALWDGRLARPD